MTTISLLTAPRIAAERRTICRAGRWIRRRRYDKALIDSHYAGRNALLRSAYDAVVATVRGFGDDVELAPKKTYVSLRRRKQFGQVGPAAGQLEVGLNLPGKAATDRLRPTSGMATHRVRITDTAGLDEELVGWLREAYERA